MTERFRSITINTLQTAQASTGQFVTTPVLLRNGQAKVLDAQSDYIVLEDSTRIYQDRSRFLVRNTLANYDMIINNENYAIGFRGKFYKILEVKETNDQQFLVLMCESQISNEAL